MRTFRFEATDRTGVEISSTIDAIDADSAIRQLRTKGYVVNSVTEVEDPAPIRSGRPEAVTPEVRSSPIDTGPPPPPRAIEGPARRPGFLVTVLTAMAGLFVFPGVFLPWVSGGDLGALVFGGVFVTAGLLLVWRAWRTFFRRRKAWRHGIAAIGRVTETGLDPTTRVNGRRPFLLQYTFDAGGRSVSGRKSTFDRLVTRYQRGDALWVVYLDDNPGVNAVWPPFR